MSMICAPRCRPVSAMMLAVPLFVSSPFRQPASMYIVPSVLPCATCASRVCLDVPVKKIILKFFVSSYISAERSGLADSGWMRSKAREAVQIAAAMRAFRPILSALSVEWHAGGSCCPGYLSGPNGSSSQGGRGGRSEGEGATVSQSEPGRQRRRSARLGARVLGAVVEL